MFSQLTIDFKKISTALAALALTVAWGVPVLASAAPNLSFSPLTPQVTAGQTVMVQVREDSGTTPVNAVQANIAYPADKLELKTVNVENSAFPITAEQTLAAGSIRLARGRSGEPATGLQPIATLTFVAKTAGVAQINYAEGSVVVDSVHNDSINASLDTATVTVTQPAPSPTPTPSATPQPTATPTPSVKPTTTPAPATDEPATLPETGALAMAGVVGLGGMGAAGVAYIRSRRDLKQALRRQ